MHPIQSLLNRFIEEKQAAGVSALIMKDGKEAFFGCAGLRRLDAPDAFDRDTIMLMYSMTKPVTAAAIMTLIDRGLLTPDTPVSEFIPEYRDIQVLRADGTLEPANTPLTIHHLLTMTSGIPYPGEGVSVMPWYVRAMQGIKDPASLTTLDLARLIAACPLCFHPGEKWLYGLSAEVLGAVVEAAAGMTLGEYMKKTLFDPLGMKDTFFRVPDEKQHRLATIYARNDQNCLTPTTELFGFALDDSQVEMGGGGLYSTLDDFARFGEMLRNEGAGLISPESVRLMTRNHLTEAQLPTYYGSADGYGYGYLVRSLMDETKNANFCEKNGCFGWNGMAGTTLRMDPARRLTVVFGVQRVSYNVLISRLMQAIDKVF